MAHGEEFFKMTKYNNSDDNIEEINEKKDILELISKSGIIGPTSYTNNIDIRYREFTEMMKIISNTDTTQLVKDDGAKILMKNNETLKSLRRDNSNVVYFSNLSEKEIWEKKEIIDCLSDLNNYLMRISVNYEIIARLEGDDSKERFYKQCLDISNKNDFQNSYSIFLKNMYWAFESITEQLFRILDQCGYNRDKNERTAESTNYDIQHAINASYCDILITNDKHFLKKARAVYYYLGIKTEVYTLNQYKDIYNL